MKSEVIEFKRATAQEIYLTIITHYSNILNSKVILTHYSLLTHLLKIGTSIHRQLINKLKVKGMNALFGLKTKLSIGDRAIVGTATATACYLSVLPAPTPPRLTCSSSWQNDPQHLQRTKKRLEERIAENEKYYGIVKGENEAANGVDQHQDGHEEEELEADFTAGNKDTCVLEVSEFCRLFV